MKKPPILLLVEYSIEDLNGVGIGVGIGVGVGVGKKRCHIGYLHPTNVHAIHLYIPHRMRLPVTKVIEQPGAEY